MQASIDLEVYLELVRILSKIREQISWKSQNLVYDSLKEKIK